MTEFNPVTFNRIKGIAKQKGYSLLSINDKAKLGKNVLYGWKTKKPSYDNVKSVADVLGVSVDYLLGNTDDMHANNKTAHQEPIDLQKYAVDDSERNEAINAGGVPISDDDWKIIKAILSKYPRKDQ